jgi:hypothetical protein
MVSRGRQAHLILLAKSLDAVWEWCESLYRKSLDIYMQICMLMINRDEHLHGKKPL